MTILKASELTKNLFTPISTWESKNSPFYARKNTKRNTPHYFIPKKSPYWNANVERVHRTIDDEYCQNPLRVWKNVYEWLNYYNFERIHLSLNGLTPQEKYLQSVTLDC